MDVSHRNIKRCRLALGQDMDGRWTSDIPVVMRADLIADGDQSG